MRGEAATSSGSSQIVQSLTNWVEHMPFAFSLFVTTVVFVDTCIVCPLYPYNRSCISRMCRTYVVLLINDINPHSSEKALRGGNQYLCLNEGGVRESLKLDFQSKREMLNNGRPMPEPKGMLQTTGQKNTRSNTHIESQFDVGTSRIDLALDEHQRLNISKGLLTPHLLTLH